MNIVRTIQAQEDPKWVALLFEEGPHEGGVPFYPPMLPFPSGLRSGLAGGYVYIVYRSSIIGYSLIREVLPHGGTDVGSEGNEVSRGYAVHSDGPYRHMPEALASIGVVGFRGPRYTEEALHELGPAAFKKAVSEARIRLK